MCPCKWGSTLHRGGVVDEGSSDLTRVFDAFAQDRFLRTMQDGPELLTVLEPELEVASEEIWVLLERGVQFITADDIRGIDPEPKAPGLVGACACTPASAGSS